jgi:hypothetical protein
LANKHLRLIALWELDTGAFREVGRGAGVSPPLRGASTESRPTGRGARRNLDIVDHADDAGDALAAVGRQLLLVERLNHAAHAGHTAFYIDGQAAQPRNFEAREEHADAARQVRV